MNKAINDGEINIVIMKSISRIARDYILTHEWLSFIKKKGVQFITMDDSHVPMPFMGEVVSLLKEMTIRQKNTCK